MKEFEEKRQRGYVFTDDESKKKSWKNSLVSSPSFVVTVFIAFVLH